MPHNLDARVAILAEDSSIVPLEGYPGAFVRAISIGEADQLADVEQDSGLVLMTMAIVDKDGAPLFTADDIAAMRKMKAAKFRAIVSQVNALDASAVETAEKN